MSNSFLVPATTAYANLIFIVEGKVNITLTPFFGMNKNYTWDLDTYNKSDELNSNSYGLTIKLNFKN